MQVHVLSCSIGARYASIRTHRTREIIIVLRVSTCATFWSGTDNRAKVYIYILKVLKLILRAFYRQDIGLEPGTVPIRRSASKLLRKRLR